MTSPRDWSHIERDHAATFVKYLDTATAQAEMQRYKRVTYDLLALGPGQSVLDVGCGTGEDAFALAERVGPTGRVVGIDRSLALIDEARRRARAAAVSRVELRVGDAQRLDVPDGSFDACRADRVFMHLPDPRAALAEMVRVARPGARIVVREPDWRTLVVHHPDRDRTRLILDRHFARAMPNPSVGTDLYAWFRRAGLVDVRVADTSTLVLTDFATANRLYGLEDAASLAATSPDGITSEASQWLRDLRNADAEGLFLSAVTGFTVIGIKPFH